MTATRVTAQSGVGVKMGKPSAGGGQQATSVTATEVADGGKGNSLVSKAGSQADTGETVAVDPWQHGNKTEVDAVAGWHPLNPLP